MSTETLNALVTAAIWRAEQLEENDVPLFTRAWLEVSVLEERLAQAIAPTEGAGRIARRGAVRAALKAREYGRALELCERYCAEEGTSRALKTALRQLLEEDAQRIADRYPHAAKHHDVRVVRDVARHFSDSGAFGLAA